MYNIAIILAAGSGKRMDMEISKQFIKLRDKEILVYSLEAFEKSKVDEIIVVSQEKDIDFIYSLAKKYNINKLKKVIEGGSERYFSVYKALCEIENTKNSKKDISVLIHDSARPLIKTDKINEIIKALDFNKALVLAVPVKDTIRLLGQENEFETCLKRDKLYIIQTPQAFIYDDLKTAYDIFINENSSIQITDDAMVLENFSDIKIKYIIGDYSNIKITTKEDINILEAYLS